MPKTFKDHEKYSKNPYLDTKGIKTGFKNTSIRVGAAVTLSSGEMPAGTLDVSRISKIDTEDFIKVYTRELYDWLELGKTSQRVLTYIFQNLPKDTDKINVTVYELMGNIGKTKSTIFAALKELLEKKIIAKSTSSDCYFINPGYIFNGSRVNFIKRLEKK